MSAPNRTAPELVQVTADQDARGPVPVAVAPDALYAPPAVGVRRSVTGLLLGSDSPGTSSAVADLSNADQRRSNPTDAGLRDANSTRARRLEIRQRVEEMEARGAGAYAADPDDDSLYWNDPMDDSKEIEDLLDKWDEEASAASWNAVNAAEADWDADDADDYTMYPDMYPDLSDYEPE